LEVFARVDPPLPFYIFPPGGKSQARQPLVPVRTLYIYRCYNFKGGLRWIPPRRGDIRAGNLVDSMDRQIVKQSEP